MIYILSRLGFGEKWKAWIGFCISSVQFSVMVNGEPVGFFSSSRGLRQGDPLSPFLFILVMEGLSRLLDMSVLGGFIHGFSLGRVREAVVTVSHLLFADDTLVFCEARAAELGYLRLVLLYFEAVSGLRVNIAKSEIMPVGNVENIGELASFFGCKVAYFPTSYLGLPLGASFKSKAIWNSVVERFENRLAGWKRQLLSKGGRLTLIRSTLSNLPTYFMSIFIIPSSVARRLEKLERNFLWEGSMEERKYHLIQWETVRSSLESGGLGIKKLKSFNVALMGKWFWRFLTDKEALWKKVVVSKYGASLHPWYPNDYESLME